MFEEAHNWGMDAWHQDQMISHCLPFDGFLVTVDVEFFVAIVIALPSTKGKFLEQVFDCIHSINKEHFMRKHVVEGL